MLARCPFSCLPLTPPLSPLMGAREYGLDEDRYLSRNHLSQILLLHPGYKTTHFQKQPSEPACYSRLVGPGKVVVKK